MIKIFAFTLLGMLFFLGAMLFRIRKGSPISSCHEGGTDQGCGFCAKSNEKKKVMKKEMLKRARALLASYYPR